MGRNTNKVKELKTATRFDVNILTVGLCVIAALFIMWTFTGQWPWKTHWYNSYILQAQSWLEGRLDLGQNYDHLEIAVFNGKYYVSFPPFPSYLMLPFVLLGWDTCDGFIAFAASIAGAVYAYKILRHFNIDENRSVFFALFLTIASNWLLTAANAWVWFIAQNLAFALSMAAVYYALKGKAGLSLSFWACAVGCRPFQALYIPVLLYLLYKKHMEDNPNDKLLDILKKKWKCLIAPFLIALSYMILNYARFGNIIEFGHNYLPEHTSSQYGQFHYVYLLHNLASIIRFPSISDSGIWEYPQFNGMCWFMISPITVAYIGYIIAAVVKKKPVNKIITLMLPILIFIHLLMLSAHVQMGGSHFGNRYPNDALPFVFLGLAILLPKEEGAYHKLNYPLFIIGICINIVGAVGYYNQFFS